MRSQYQFHIYPVWRQERTFHRNRTGSGRWSDGDVYAEHTEGNRVSDMDHAIEEGNEGTDQVLAYIYGYKEEFQLLFCHSAGTEYEDYFDKLAAIEEQYYNIFAKQYANENATADEFFIHVFCRTGWQYIYEVLTHDKPYDEAAAFMKNVQIFNFAGWKSVFGLE